MRCDCGTGGGNGCGLSTIDFFNLILGSNHTCELVVFGIVICGLYNKLRFPGILVFNNIVNVFVRFDWSLCSLGCFSLFSISSPFRFNNIIAISYKSLTDDSTFVLSIVAPPLCFLERLPPSFSPPSSIYIGT